MNKEFKCGTKTCTKCKEEKSLEEFGKLKCGKNGIHPKCKICTAKASRDWARKNKNLLKERSIKNKDKKAATQRRYREKHKDKLLKKEREYRKNNKEAVAKSKKKWADNNKDKTKKWFEDNKEHVAEQKKIYREKNKEKIAARKVAHHEKNRDRLNEYRRQHYVKNKEKHLETCREWYKNNKERVKTTSAAYYSQNKDKFITYSRNYYQKIKDDTQFKLKACLRAGLQRAIRRAKIKKKGSGMRDLGCSIDFLMKHLEGMFHVRPKTGEKMTWDNHGFYGWHIDHIKPLSSFNLENREELLEACHYTNLQPLWAEDNLKKGNRPQ